MRILVLALALLLTLGILMLTIHSSSSLLGFFSALTDGQQRLAGGALTAFSAIVLGLAGWLRHRKAALPTP